MSNRLKKHLGMWRKTTTDAFVLSVIDKGYRIQWNPKLGPPPPSEQLNSKNCENYKEFISKSIEEALSMGVVREVTRDQLHNVLPLKVNVKKSNGKLRLIFNVMFINDYMSIPKSKYPQLHREGREIFRGVESRICY